MLAGREWLPVCRQRGRGSCALSVSPIVSIPGASAAAPQALKTTVLATTCAPDVGRLRRLKGAWWASGLWVALVAAAWRRLDGYLVAWTGSSPRKGPCAGGPGMLTSPTIGRRQHRPCEPGARAWPRVRSGPFADAAQTRLRRVSSARLPAAIIRTPLIGPALVLRWTMGLGLSCFVVVRTPTVGVRRGSATPGRIFDGVSDLRKSGHACRR